MILFYKFRLPYGNGLFSSLETVDPALLLGIHLREFTAGFDKQGFESLLNDNGALAFLKPRQSQFISRVFG